MKAAHLSKALHLVSVVHSATLAQRLNSGAAAYTISAASSSLSSQRYNTAASPAASSGLKTCRSSTTSSSEKDQRGTERRSERNE